MFEKALAAIKAGHPAAIPTDTTFGLVADASNPAAIEQLYALKGRPTGQPFQVLVNSLNMAQSLAEFSIEAKHIARTFWPGPLTLVLPFKANAPISKTVTGSRPTIGMRWPENEALCNLISELGKPLVASSANRSGEMPLKTAEAIRDAFPQLVVEDGEAAGTASTIAELRDGELILYRQGVITESMLREAIA